MMSEETQFKKIMDAKNSLELNKQIAIANFKLQYISIEYSEINRNIRVSWKHIADLLSRFLVMQLVILSLTMLNGNLIKVENSGDLKFSLKSGISSATQGIGTEAVFQHSSGNSKTLTRGKANFSTNSQKNVIEAQTRPLAVYILMGVGALLALAAALQNFRLFKNSINFIKRAAYLEELGAFQKDEAKGDVGAIKALNIYMRDRLTIDTPIIKMKFWLTFAYSTASFVWVFSIHYSMMEKNNWVDRFISFVFDVKF